MQTSHVEGVGVVAPPLGKAQQHFILVVSLGVRSGTGGGRIATGSLGRLRGRADAKGGLIWSA